MEFWLLELMVNVFEEAQILHFNFSETLISERIFLPEESNHFRFFLSLDSRAEILAESPLGFELSHDSFISKQHEKVSVVLSVREERK